MRGVVVWLNMTLACTCSKVTDNECHSNTHTLILTMCQPPSSVLPSCFDPPFPPPSSFLPRQSLSASQHIRGRVGLFDPKLFNSPPLSLSLAPVFPLSSSLSDDSPLSHRNGLHYLPSTPSSKMTFCDFTKARQFDSVKSPRSERGKWKVLVSCKVHEWHHRPEGVMSRVSHHHQSGSRGY